MLLLTLVCALIGAAAVAVVAAWHRLVPVREDLAHEKALYAGFVADVERRLARGEIDSELAQEERVEAGRALLKAQAGVAESRARPIQGIIVAAAAAALSFGLYLSIGHPGLKDQPYRQRVQQWTHAAQADPDSVPPDILAVVLRQGAKDHARDARFWLFLGRIDMLAGHSYEGMKDYKTALGLQGDAFTAWSELGEAMTLTAGDKVSPEARTAFDAALKLDPNDSRAHYYLGRNDVAQGRYDAGRAHFEAALAHMAIDNPSRPVLQQELKNIAVAQSADTAAKGRIAGMVASLAAQLKADPDNADGWARLLRSYDVLGDTAAHDAALDAMRAHYRDHPDVAAAILAKSQAAVGAEGGA